MRAVCLVLLFFSLSTLAYAQRIIQEYEPDFDIEYAQKLMFSSMLNYEQSPVMHNQFYSKTCHNKRIKKIERVTKFNDSSRRYLIEDFDEDGYIRNMLTFDLYVRDTYSVIGEKYMYNSQRDIITVEEIKRDKSYCEESIVHTFYFNRRKKIDSIRTNVMSDKCELSTDLTVYCYDSFSRLEKVLFIKNGEISKTDIRYRLDNITKYDLKHRLLYNPVWSNDKRRYNNIIPGMLSCYGQNFEKITLQDSAKSDYASYIAQNDFFYCEEKGGWFIYPDVSWDYARLYEWNSNGRVKSSFSWVNASAIYKDSYNQLYTNVFGRLKVKRSSGDYFCKKLFYRRGVLNKVCKRKGVDFYIYEYFH